MVEVGHDPGGLQVDPEHAEGKVRTHLHGAVENTASHALRLSAELERGARVVLCLERKAAEQGNVEAQYRLGTLLYKGEGIPQDYAAAFTWMKKAAAHRRKDRRSMWWCRNLSPVRCATG